MPPYSTLRTFVDALRTGETNITRCLERLANDPSKRQAHLPWIQQYGALNAPFPEWLRTELVQAGMSEREIDHIERWPDQEKETARAQLVTAINESRPLRFGWEIFEGDRPRSDARREADQNIRVVFRSPRSGIRLGGVNMGSVHVEA